MASRQLDTPTRPFDGLAPAYDQRFSRTALGRWLRSAVWRQIDDQLGLKGRILDIGCGTGDDALHLAARGFEVVAIDASHSMVEIARAKAIQSGLADRIDFHCMDADAIDRSFPREFFDGAISNFGALNCSSRLVALSNEIASLLRPDAPLVLVLMGRYVPWEWAWFIARLKWRKAFRRISKQGATWRGIRIHYHSPTKLAREIRSKFRLIRCTALGILLPPSYASGWLESRPRTFAALASIERILSRFTFLAHIADHYVLTFRRLEKRNPCD